MGRLSGKVALITGGSSGIGYACAHNFLKEGADVVIASRHEENGVEAKERLDSENWGGSVHYIRCDVTNISDIEYMRSSLEEWYGRLDILMNNAGILKTASLEEMTSEDWDDVYNTNVKSAILVTQKFIDFLKISKGVILNNASINGLHSYIKGKRSYMYATSKSALIQLTKYMAKNYAPDIRVNCLCPGMTVTNLFTNRDFTRFEDCNLMGRMALPEEIANVATFLVSDEASFMTGSVVVADGGEILK